MYVPINIDEAIRKEGLRRRLSPRTIETYQNCVRKFLESCGKTIDIVSKKDIREYLEELAERKISGSTLNVNLQALKFFFSGVMGERMKIYLKYSRVPLKLPVVLSKEEVSRLLESIGNSKHRFIVSFMYSTGMRVSELVNLKIEDLELKRSFGWVRHGKGNKDRMFIIAEKVKPQLIELTRDRSELENLFLTNKKEKYSTNTIAIIIKKAAKLARINKNVHPHTLRHSFATHLIGQGESIASVQSLLGHESPETTMIYLHTAAPNIIKVKSPLDNF